MRVSLAGQPPLVREARRADGARTALEPVGQQTTDAAIANDQHPGTKQRCRQLLHGDLNGSLHRGHCIFDGQFLSLKIVINTAALFSGRAHKFRVQLAAAQDLPRFQPLCNGAQGDFTVRQRSIQNAALPRRRQRQDHAVAPFNAVQGV